MTNIKKYYADFPFLFKGLRLLKRQKYVESRSVVFLALGIDKAMMQVDDFFTNSEPDTRARYISFAMKSLKNRKDLVTELFGKPEAIIGNNNLRILQPLIQCNELLVVVTMNYVFADIHFKRNTGP
jgi:hypothetical protein